jgi:hypothetical protein
MAEQIVWSDPLLQLEVAQLGQQVGARGARVPPPPTLIDTIRRGADARRELVLEQVNARVQDAAGTPQQAVIKAYYQQLKRRMMLVAGSYFTNLGGADWKFLNTAILATDNWERTATRFQTLASAATAMPNFGNTVEAVNGLTRNRGNEQLHATFRKVLDQLDSDNNALFGQWTRQNEQAHLAALGESRGSDFTLPFELENWAMLPDSDHFPVAKLGDTKIAVRLGSGRLSRYEVPLTFLPDIDDRLKGLGPLAGYYAPTIPRTTVPVPGSEYVGFGPGDPAVAFAKEGSDLHGGMGQWSGLSQKAYTEVFPTQVAAAGAIVDLCSRIVAAVGSLRITFLDYVWSLVSAVAAYYNYVVAAEGVYTAVLGATWQSDAADMDFLKAIRDIDPYSAIKADAQGRLANDNRAQAFKAYASAFASYWSTMGAWLKNYSSLLGGQQRYAQDIKATMNLLSANANLTKDSPVQWINWTAKEDDVHGYRLAWSFNAPPITPTGMQTTPGIGELPAGPRSKELSAGLTGVYEGYEAAAHGGTTPPTPLLNNPTLHPELLDKREPQLFDPADPHLAPAERAGIAIGYAIEQKEKAGHQ